MLAVGVAWTPSDDNALRYVLSILWMHIMEQAKAT